MNCNKTTEDQQPKGQAKAKSLSLQQYRQLRQRRQPLVEKQGNNTTKWPSVPEPPKELTPILCLQKQNSCRPKTAHHYPDLRKPDYMSSCRVSSTHRLQPSEARSSTHSRLNRQSTESKVISPTSPLAGGIVPERKKSPVKKPTPLSSDPPNPVLLPLPVLQIASPSTSNSSSASKVEFSSRDSSLQGNRQLQEIHNESSAATLQRQTFSSELNPQVSALIKDCNQESTALLQDMKTVFTEIPPDDSSTSQEQKTSQCIKPQIQKCSLSSLKDSQPLARTPPALSPDTKRPIKCSSVTPHFSQPLQSHIDASGSATEVQTHSMSPPEEPPPPQSGCRVQGATAGSGIEASDLTSLLEQFEETQAKEEGVCENEPALVRAASLPLMPSVGPLESLSTSETQKLQTLEGMDVPEPLSTEIILSTQQPARRKNPLSKVIQIIDPRPLPSRKTHTTPSESRATRASPHMYAHISSDHDYCGSVDHSPANAFQRSRAKPSLLKDASQTTNDQRSESSSCSSSPSCSVSRSPPRRYRSRRYTSRSSRSRSRSWSTSRSRSPSPQICCRRWRDFCSSRESRKLRREHDMRIQKLKAIDERRVVYVGRIRRSMTHDELRERFSQFGEVECVSLHFRDRGDHYGFVTFYNMEDAFAAIDNGGKLRQPDELPFDICFGGRRQFCSSDYTDLDANRDAEASPSRTRFEDLDFDSLLKQAQRGSKR
ncbi:peroxisome proliferator-activated receptor gamma coactivator-related protein 1 isoform X5 [Archocentrus centrarchus]|uniref:peroxisome proliferator-activated receptor gamma coactivator-related protein 1 isoform X5 n=1 Tax=Archocentrus centrarchus TaxID=63155 RepID=UPI0011E9C4AB|nr:peroxisome proliferator-activated receptor gamma coactivator-related protein 1-like isoform X5 [Archocentrus centrarchus]